MTFSSGYAFNGNAPDVLSVNKITVMSIFFYYYLKPVGPTKEKFHSNKRYTYALSASMLTHQLNLKLYRIFLQYNNITRNSKFSSFICYIKKQNVNIVFKKKCGLRPRRIRTENTSVACCGHFSRWPFFYTVAQRVATTSSMLN